MSAVLAPRRDDAGLVIDSSFLDDPYPAYERLRARGPVLWSEAFGEGAWVVTRHADGERVLADPRFSARRTGAWVGRFGEGMRDFQPLFARALLFLDDPDHARLRPLMQQAFTPSALQGLRETIRLQTRSLLSQAEAGSNDDVDFIARVARPLPARVMARLLGLPESMDEAFAAWSDDLAAFIGQPQPRPDQARRAQHSLIALARSFEPLIAQRRCSPGDDLIGRLVRAESAGQIHGSAELLAQCAMLLFAGHETTRNLLGNAVQTLLSHPGAWAALAAEPALVPGAVREVLRYECPVQYTGRRVTTDTVLHGRHLKRGDLVVALIGAANRDPARYDEAQRFDPARKAGSSLAFGHGVHLCIGAALTLMEGEAALRALVRRWPGLRLAAGTQARWEPNPVYRGLATLPLTF